MTEPISSSSATVAVIVDVGAGYPLVIRPGRMFLPPGDGDRAEAVLADRPGRARRVRTDHPRRDGFVEFVVENDTDDGHEAGDVGEASDEERRAVRLGIRTLEEVQALRAAGLQAQPNHVLVSHQVQGFPMKGFPMKGFPMKGFPMKGFGAGGADGMIIGALTLTRPLTDLASRPARTWPGTAEPLHTSTAEPADDPGGRPASFGDSTAVRVLVLDTGLPEAGQRPGQLAGASDDAAGDDADVPDGDTDKALDVQAGHGTFIAGLIGRLAPGCHVIVRRVLDGRGLGEEDQVADLLQEYAGKVDLVNMSMGTYTPIQPRLLESAVRAVQSGVGSGGESTPPRPGVVVASVGNDASWLPAYPAALPDVVSVAALDADGPADFTNMGPWVRACAPGTDLVSTFFSSFTSVERVNDEQRQRTFRGWARWSGTSFAAPVVLAALARAMQNEGLTAPQAVPRVVDAPGLLRLPMLGTVVNVL